MSKVQWLDLLIAIIAGVALGVIVSLIAHWAGLPSKMIGPVAGGIIAPAISLIYMQRARRREKLRR